MRLITSSFRRKSPHIIDSKLKSLNYLDNVLAKIQAVVAGVDDAIMLDLNGFVAECTGENIFMVREGNLYTPPLASILAGLTRDSLIDIAVDMEISVIEQPISRDQLYTADEVFVCGTAAEVVGVREIDFRSIGNGGVGPITTALMDAFENVVRGRDVRYADWLDVVVLESAVK